MKNQHSIDGRTFVSTFTRQAKPLQLKMQRKRKNEKRKKKIDAIFYLNRKKRVHKFTW